MKSLTPVIPSLMYVYAQLLNGREILNQMISDQANWLHSMRLAMDHITPTSLDIAQLQDAKVKRDQMIQDLDWCEKAITEIETCGCLGKDVAAQPLNIPT